ncbi:MAG: hypothetical protein NT027_20170 [Proteobacteria bacterium]|nr:hypothetical protein [Pseudomonadota bacterium]
MNNLRHAIASLILSGLYLIWSEAAFSLVGAELSIGSKSSLVKQLTPVSTQVGKGAGMSTTVDAFVQPMASLPVNVGVYYGMDSISGTADSGNKYKMSQKMGGILVGVTYPVTIVTLMLKGGYILTGSSSMGANSTDDYKAKTGISESSFSAGKLSGYKISGGLAYSILPMLEATLTYSAVTESVSFQSSSTVLASDGRSVESDFSESPVNVTTAGSIIAIGMRFKI